MIRAATADDAAAIAALHVRSFHHAYPGIVPDEILAQVDLEERVDLWERWFGDAAAGPTFVADTAGRIYGFCALEGPLLRNLHVEPAAQGAGLGSGLLACGEVALRDAGVVRAELRVFEANGLARAFYERHGWSTDGAAFPDRDGWAPAVLYTKAL